MSRPYTTAAKLYDRAYADKDYRGEAGKVVRLVDRRIPWASTLLDVGCGAGRHLLHLADRFEVAGVDNSSEILAIARDRLDVPLFRADMVEMDLGRRYDVVTCLFSGIGYVRPLDRLHAAVANLARHASPGGLVIVEPWVTPSTWRRDDVDVQQAEDRSWVRMSAAKRRGSTSFLDMHWLVAETWGVEHHSERHTLELYTVEQYRSAFEEAGMAVEYDPEGLIGRGLMIGTVPGDPSG